MIRRVICGGLAVATLLVCSSAGWASLGGYSQDFEGMLLMDNNALADDGWLVFGNVFDSGGSYLFGYGVFPAPNHASPDTFGIPGFSALVFNEGGPDQGTNQLSVFSDYGCCSGDFAHQGDGYVETYVFQEQIIGAENVGETWSLSFDAKMSDQFPVTGSSSAFAFIKTLDPNSGFAETNFLLLDMTMTSGEWTSYSFSIDMLVPELAGQLLQFGFLTSATNYDTSTVIYDNVEFSLVPIPAAVWLFASGLAGLFGLRRRSGSI